METVHYPDSHEECCRKYSCGYPRYGNGIVYGANLGSGITDKRTFKIDYGVKVTELNDGRFKTWNQRDTLYSA